VAFVLGANAVVTFGLSMQAVALGWQVYDSTGSALDLGLLGLVEFLPSALLVVVTGHVADRRDRRHVASFALLGQMAVAAGFATYAASRGTSVVPILALGFAFGVGRAFQTPSSRSLLPSVAPPEELSSAVALSSLSWQFSAIAGPPLGAFLYHLAPWAVYVVTAVLCGVGILAYQSVRPQVVTRLSNDPPSIRTALEGLRFIRRSPLVLGAITLDLFAVLFGGAVALLPIYARDILDVGVGGLGWLRAAGGIGAAATAILLAARPIERRVGTVLMIAVGVFGAATIVFGLSKSFALSLVMLALLSGADMVSVFIRSTLVPLATPDHLRGRVVAVEHVFIGASNELGAFESGVAAAAIGVVPAVVLGGVATMGVVVASAFVFPAMRTVDRFADVHKAVPDSG
jgi:MFS family permease